MNGLFATWLQKTCADTPNATSSQASVAGRTPCVSPDGQTTAQSGPAPARASRSQSQEKGLVPTIQGTYGLTSFGSYVPPGLLSSWESRLRERLAMVGSTELPLTWKVKTTPAGRLMSRLAPSMRRTSAAASIGSQATWPTPLKSDADGGARPADSKRGPMPGLRAATAATWPTPRSSDEKNGNGKTGNRTPEAAAKAGWTLPELARATWPTPTSRDYKDGSFCANVETNGLLGRTVWNGPSEQTEKPGALNPEFVCWLMGFPPEWESYAPTAMPSSRKSRQK